MAEVGDQAPDFTLPTTDGEVKLSDLTARGKVVLAFYYEDATPLCANEISMLKEDYGVVRELAADVIGISADDLNSHRAFSERLGGLPFAPATRSWRRRGSSMSWMRAANDRDGRCS